MCPNRHPTTLETDRALQATLVRLYEDAETDNHDACVARRVIRMVATETGVPTDMIVGRRRERWMVDARHLAMWLLRRHTPMTLVSVGRAFGRDHSTVIHAVQNVHAQIDTSAEFRALAARLDQQAMMVLR